MADLTDKQWRALAVIALIAGSAVLRDEARKQGDKASPLLDITADYLESIRDQAPRG